MKKFDFTNVVLLIVLSLLVLVSYNIYITLKDAKRASEQGEKKEIILPLMVVRPLWPYPKKHAVPDSKVTYPDSGIDTASTAPVTHEDKPGTTYAAIVIDDIGVSPKAANDFITLGIDFTFSVLPNEQYSDELYKLLKDRGYELMLHLPMEPHNYPEDNDPGDDALMVSMSDSEIESKTKELLERFPAVVGVNNHMGSKLCEECGKLVPIMGVVRGKGLFFLDSLTSPKSCISEVAEMHYVPNIKRNVFLDNSKEEESIIAQIERLINISKKYGYAVAICHPYTETFEVLKKYLHLFEKNNVKIVRLSKIIKTSPHQNKDK